LHLRSVYILVYLGFLGLLLFLLLRPSIDFNANAPLEMSREGAELHAIEIASGFGIDGSEMSLLARRQQRTSLYTQIKDSLETTTKVSPSMMNASGIPFQGWSVIFAGNYENFTAITTDEALFDEVGIIQIQFDNVGRVRTFRSNTGNNATFLSGENLDELLESALSKMGYDAQRYDKQDPLDLGITQRDFTLIQRQSNSFDGVQNRVQWLKINLQTPGPSEITLHYRTEIVVEEVEGVEVYISGIRIENFHTSHHEFDIEGGHPVNLNSSAVFLTFGSVILLILVVLVTGIRQIFKGEVIWKRGVIIFALVFLGYVGYRVMLLFNLYYRVLDGDIVALDIVIGSVLALAEASVMALAYMSWESYARKQNQEQIPLVDAIWNGNVFQKRIGKAILAGYGYAGLALSMWAIGLYAFDQVYFQYDGQFGFLEPSTWNPVVSTLTNSWLYTWIVSFAAIGVMISLLQIKLKRSLIQIPIAVIFISILLSNGYMFVSVTGTIFQKIIIFSLLSVPLVFAFKYYGVFTSAVSIWLLFMVVRLYLYIGSTDSIIVLYGYLLSTITMIPFVIGLILYHFGRNEIHELRFEPEYETRLKKQMRMEREFQIAKESQFALMPKTSPNLTNTDVRGFFIPSFDVGGDFYDHIIVNNDEGNPEELVLTVVDVSGKAMKAAISAIFTSGLILSRVKGSDKDPALVLRDINAVMHERLDKQMFVTCVFARYDLNTMQLTFVNAGHCHPVLVRDGKGQFVESVAPRLPLAVKRIVDYKSTTLQLKSGDTLLLYSDGLPEARAKNGELYDYENVTGFFERVVAESTDSASICEKIKQEMLTFSDYDLADDLTVVVLKV
jgi:serine phosphatase RsbU (regulator of sigma subunit)